MLARSMAFLVAVAFSFLWLLGCSTAPVQPQPTAAKPAAGQPAAATQPAAKAAVPTGTLRLAAAGLGNEAMDPIVATGSNKVFFELIYDSLISLNADGDFDPKVSLAEKWDVAPDSTSYTFYIRKGVKFHNGDDLTAEDVKFSVERMMGPKSKAPYIAGMQSNIAKIELVDPYTIRLQMKAPYIFLISNLSNASGNEGMIMPKKYIEAVGDDGFATKPVGSGPYKFVDHRKGDYLKLEAVDKHWKVGVPKYKEVMWRVIPEEATRAALLQRGEVDMIDVTPRTSKDLEKAGFKRYVKPGGQNVSFVFNVQWEPPFNNVKVRHLLNIAIDRKAINDSIFDGMGDPSGNFPLTPADMAYTTKTPPHPYDPTKAKEILKEVGTLKVRMYSYELQGLPNGQRMVEAVASMWKAVGVDVRITAGEYGAWLDAWRNKTLVGGDVGYVRAANNALSGSMGSMIGRNGVFAVVEDPKAAELRDAILSSKSLAEYKERANAMQKYAMDAYLWAPIADLGDVYMTAASINNLRVPGKEFASWGLVNLVTQ